MINRLLGGRFPIVKVLADSNAALNASGVLLTITDVNGYSPNLKLSVWHARGVESHPTVTFGKYGRPICFAAVAR